MNVGTLLERTAQRWPSRPAIVDDATSRSFTFAEFFAYVLACASGIGRLVDERRGSRVALLGDATIEYLGADYGAMTGGFVRVPLDPSLSLEELAAQLDDADASTLLFGSRQTEVAQQIQARRPALRVAPLDTLAASASSVMPGLVRCAASDLASLNYTGGSTGKPKAVVLTHGNLSAILQNIVMSRPMGPGDIFLNVRPLWPIAAVTVLAHAVAGATIVNGGHFTPDRFWMLLGEHDITATSLVPTQLVRLLRDVPQTAPRIGKLAFIDIGAAAVTFDVLEEAIALFGRAIGVIYGLTEASWSCYRHPHDIDILQRDRPETHGYVGRPLFGCEVAVIENDVPVATGAVAEVCIRGSHVMQGYWNQPQLSAEALRGGWFHTGDLGWMDAAGRLYLAGRLKDIIRTGGKTVQPSEVEKTLLAHPAVLEACVIGLPDVEWGEIVAAGVTVRPDATTSSDDLTAYCRTELSSYKRPKVIRVLAELPKSHYGKVQKSKLAALLTGIPAQ